MTLEEVQNQAIQTYNQNIEYFKNNHPQLHKNLELYNTAIDLKQIEPNFDLQYVNGYFDIISTKNNQFLYNQNSLEISKKLVENITKDATQSTFKTFYEYAYNDALVKEGLESDILGPYTRGNAPVIHYINKNLPNNQIVKNVEKFIVFGVLLGLHIPLIHEKLNCKVYLIVEPNLEFFRLSLFTTNYAQLAQKSKLFFSVAQNEFEFRNKFDEFYGEFFILNHLLKFMNISDSCDLYIKTIQNFLVSQPHFLYSYDRTFSSLSRTNKYISENFKILNIEGKKALKSFKKPILFLAAGPSLQYNMEFIRKNKNKFTIVAIYATLPILERNGIVPDIITQYDEQDIQVLNTLDKLKEPKFFDESIFIFASHVNSKLTDTFPKENTFIFQAMFELKEKFGMLTSPSIGELTYALLLKLGAKELYLLGLDLALDVETGASHMEGHSGAGGFKKLKDEDDSDDKNYSYRKNTIKVKGNFLPEVKSVPVFKSNIDTFAIFTSQLKDISINVYNLSNGAYLEGTTPLRIENINLNTLEKSNKEDIFQELKSISEIGYNKEDIEKLNLKISSVKKIKKIVEQFAKVKKYKTYQDYYDNLINTVHNILFEKHHCEDLKSILLNYSWHNLHFIFHFLNLENIDMSKNHVYEINKALCTQLDKIINTYTICITYSNDENSHNLKKLNKFLKEYNIKDSIYSEPFFKELAQTAKKTLQKEFEENSVGFFATEDNLQNKEFIDYVKELCKKFENIKLKLFYFFDVQKISAQTILKKELPKIEFIHPLNILDISSKVEFWIESSEKTNNLIKVNDLVLNNFNNIYSSFMNESSEKLEKNQTLKSPLLSEINENHFIKNTAYYNFANSFKEEFEEDKLLELYEEKSIGFLGVKENIQKEFLEHVGNILNKFPNLKLKIFYFDESLIQEYSLIFINFNQRIEFITPKNIFDIAKNCEIWVQARIKDASILHAKIWKLIQNDTLNIYPMVLKEEFELVNSSDYKQSIIEKYDEKSFSKQLNANLDENRLQNTKPKDCIGFLATEDNLNDKDFIQLMNILLNKFPQIKFKAFYFNDEQKSITSKLFSSHINNFDFIIPTNIYDITENISTYIHSLIKGKMVKTQTYYKVWQILNQNKTNLFKLHLLNEIFEEDKYFESLELVIDSKVEFEKSIVSKIFARDEKYNEYCFLNSANIQIEEEKYIPKNIGFLITEENIKDSMFIDYINELVSLFPSYSFIGFYIEPCNYQISNYLNNSIQTKKAKNIYEVMSSIEIFIFNPNNKNLLQLALADSSIYYKNVYFLRFNNDDETKTFDSTTRIDKNHLIYKNLDYFEIQKRDILENDYIVNLIIHNISLQSISKELILKKEDNISIFMKYKRIEYILKYSEYKKHLIAYRKKRIELNLINKRNK